MTCLDNALSMYNRIAYFGKKYRILIRPPVFALLLPGCKTVKQLFQRLGTFINFIWEEQTH